MSQRGQVLPLALALGLVILAGGMAVAAFAAVHATKARAQAAADTAAISAGRRLQELLPRLAALPRRSRIDPTAELAAAAAPSAAASRARLLEVRALSAGVGAPTEVEVRVAVAGPWGTEVRAAARAGVAAATPGADPVAGGCPVAAAAATALRDAARADGVEVIVRDDAVLPGAPPEGARWLSARAPGFGFAPDRGRWRYVPGCGRSAVEGPRPVSAEAALPDWVPPGSRSLVARSAASAGIPGVLLAALLQVESGFDPTALSPAGAAGIAQFMPATAAAAGLRDPFDADRAVPAAARLLAGHLRAFGSVPLALAAYDAGAGAVRRHGGVPPYAETRGYVARVVALMGGLGSGSGGVVLVRAGDAFV